MTVRKCPKCGSTKIDVVKTWNLISPLPDREGRITLTVMGVFKCSNCGYSWKGTVSKLKIGRGVEAGVEGKQVIVEEEERSPPKEIVLDLEEILEEEEK